MCCSELSICGEDDGGWGVVAMARGKDAWHDE